MKIRKIINRMKKPILKKFPGRSFIAKHKLRCRGKFVRKIKKCDKKIFKTIKNHENVL